MPIYEFECRLCGNHFERLQKLSDADPTTCPQCGKESIKRCLTAPQFRLAGSGWYETDFKKDGDRKRNLAGKDEAPKPEAKAEAGSNAKSESAPASKESAKSAPATTPVAPKPSGE